MAIVYARRTHREAHFTGSATVRDVVIGAGCHRPRAMQHPLRTELTVLLCRGLYLGSGHPGERRLRKASMHCQRHNPKNRPVDHSQREYVHQQHHDRDPKRLEDQHDRARFDKRERRIYSHDTGVLPGSFQLLAGPSLADDMTVTVRAGTVWMDLEDALAAYGLALRLYPTSAPESTVGGWFITLMTPDGMLGVMDALTPNLLDVMPSRWAISCAPSARRRLRCASRCSN